MSFANFVSRASVVLRLVARTSAGRGTSPASSRSRAAVVANTRVRVGDQRAQLAVALAQRVEHLAGVAHQPCTSALLRVEDLQQLRGVLGERRQVAERVGDVLPAALRGQRRAAASRSGTPRASSRRRRGRSRRARRSATPAPAGSVPFSATVPALVRARRQLDVGLAEQRLLAQDRPRVLRDRRVLGVELDRRVARRRSSWSASIDLDLAHRDAGDPDVGLRRQLRGLLEGDVEAVALGLQRDRAAEGQPQEQQQAEARQREARHDEDAAEAGCLLLH